MNDADAVPIGHQHTGHGIAPGTRVVQQPQRGVVGADVQRARHMVERALHLGAGGIAAGVHDAPPRMPAFAAERPAAG